MIIIMILYKIISENPNLFQSSSVRQHVIPSQLEPQLGTLDSAWELYFHVPKAKKTSF